MYKCMTIFVLYLQDFIFTGINKYNYVDCSVYNDLLIQIVLYSMSA